MICAYYACLKDKASQDPVFIFGEETNSETPMSSLEFTLFPELENLSSPCPTWDEFIDTSLDTPFDVPSSPSYDNKPSFDESSPDETPLDKPSLSTELSSTMLVRSFHPSRFDKTQQMKNARTSSIRSLMKRILLAEDHVEKLIQYYLVGLLLHEREQARSKQQMRKNHNSSITPLKKWFKDATRRLNIGQGLMNHFRIARRTHALFHTRGVEQFSRIKSLSSQDILEASASELQRAYQIACSLGKYQGPFDFSTHL
jgi:hypothetical protein